MERNHTDVTLQFPAVDPTENIEMHHKIYFALLATMYCSDVQVLCRFLDVIRIRALTSSLTESNRRSIVETNHTLR
jgi:hypothetical protein